MLRARAWACLVSKIAVCSGGSNTEAVKNYNRLLYGSVLVLESYFCLI